MSEQTPTCRRAEVLINRRLDRECSHGESTELDHHLAACPQCRAEYRSARGLEALFAQIAIPDSTAARNRFKSSMGELVRKSPASKPVTQLRIPTARRKMWFSAIAALLAVAFVGTVAILIQKDSKTPEVASLSIKFNDRLSVLENLNERTLQAASQTPGTEMARTHEQLATDLAASILFEVGDAVARDEAASSYIRTHTLALFPELQEGQLDKDRLPDFRSRHQAVSAAKPATSTLSLATAVSAYAVEFLEGRTNSTPPFNTPKAGASLQSAFSDATIAMRDASQPLDRAQILDQVAERVLAEASRGTLSPADSARLQNIATVLSSRGTQNQLRLAARDVRDGDAQRAALLLKSDAARLEKLQGMAEKLPPQQQERVLGALAVTRASNRKMQETLNAPVEQKIPAPQNIQPPAKPADPVLQKTTEAVTPIQNIVPAITPKNVPEPVPVLAVPVAPIAPIAPAGINAPNNGNAPTPALETGKKTDTNSGKENAPGQIKKSEGAEVKVPPGQTIKNEGPAASKSKGVEKSEAASSRGGPPDKTDRPEAIERPEKPERPERPERPENIDKPDRPEKVERADKPDHSGTEKPERAERPEKPERPERPDVPEKPDRPDKPDVPSNNGGGNNGGGNGNGNGSGNGNGGTGTGTGNGNGGTGNGNGNGGTIGGGTGTGNGNGNGNGGNGAGNNPGKPVKPDKPAKNGR